MIVPIYNTEKYVDKCINSIACQTYKNLEIILVDDGSTDSSPAICDEWARRDNRIKVIHKENGGQSSARNRGLDIASGEYIGFVDSDDYIMSDMFQTLYDLLHEYDADMSMIGAAPSTEIEVLEGRKILEKMIVPYRQKHHSLNFGVVFNRLYKAYIFNELRFIEGIIHEDMAAHRILGLCRRAVFFYSTKSFYHYTANRSDSTMTKIAQLSLNQYNTEPLETIPTFYGIKRAYDDRYEYLMSMKMNDLAKISYLRFSVYHIHVHILRKVNYMQYRTRIKEFTGISTFHAVVKLLLAWNFQIKLRGINLAIKLFKNIFQRHNRE